MNAKTPVGSGLSSSFLPEPLFEQHWSGEAKPRKPVTLFELLRDNAGDHDICEWAKRAPVGGCFVCSGSLRVVSIRRIAFLIMAIGAFIFQAEALAFDNGNELLADLQSRELLKYGALQWVAGVLAGASHIDQNFNCDWTGKTKSQAADLVQAYLLKYPAVRHKDAVTFTLAAAVDAGWCSYKSPTPQNTQRF